MQPDTYLVVTHDDGTKTAFGRNDTGGKSSLTMTSEFNSDGSPHWANADSVSERVQATAGINPSGGGGGGETGYAGSIENALNATLNTATHLARLLKS